MNQPTYGAQMCFTSVYMRPADLHRLDPSIVDSRVTTARVDSTAQHRFVASLFACSVGECVFVAAVFLVPRAWTTPRSIRSECAHISLKASRVSDAHDQLRGIESDDEEESKETTVAASSSSYALPSASFVRVDLVESYSVHPFIPLYLLHIRSIGFYTALRSRYAYAFICSSLLFTHCDNHQ